MDFSAFKSQFTRRLISKKLDNMENMMYSQLEILVRQDMFEHGFDPDIPESVIEYWKERLG